MHFSVTTPEARRIRASGNCIRKGTVNVRFLPSPEYRYSVVVSKAQGNAVARNRLKRCIREMLRLGETNFPNGLFLVFYRGMCSEYSQIRVERDLTAAMQDIAKTDYTHEQDTVTPFT